MAGTGSGREVNGKSHQLATRQGAKKKAMVKRMPKKRGVEDMEGGKGTEAPASPMDVASECAEKAGSAASQPESIWMKQPPLSPWTEGGEGGDRSARLLRWLDAGDSRCRAGQEAGGRGRGDRCREHRGRECRGQRQEAEEE